jgi:uncharacterized Rmd1/YagE family protein
MGGTMEKDEYKDLDERLRVLEDKYKEMDDDLTDMVKKINSTMSTNRLISIASSVIMILIFLYFVLIYLPALRH